MSVIIIVLISIPATSAENQIAMANLFSILLDYAIFAFMINLLREMIKDIEDIKTINKKMKTLPVIIGANNATKIILL
jgi:4-hydroxybenzoate polyprenyltransferase